MQVCQIGRAVLIMNGTEITVVVDKPTSATQLFSTGNIIEGSFKETFLSLMERAEELEIDFMNQGKDYDRDQINVFTDKSTISHKTTIQLFGITKASEAWRAGLYRLYCNKYLLRTVEFKANVDAIACTIGDRINFQHDVTLWGDGGRLIKADSTSVTLDKVVTIEAGKTYILLVRLENAETPEQKTITNSSGDTEVLYFSSPFSSTPNKYDLYMFGESTLLPKTFKIVNVKRDKDSLDCTLTGVNYDERIYYADYLPPQIKSDTTSMDSIPQVTNLQLVSIVEPSSVYGSPIYSIIVSWDKPENPMWKEAEVWYCKIDSTSSGGWINFSTTTNSSEIITPVEKGQTYGVVIVSKNIFNQKINFSDSPYATITLIIDNSAPSTPTGLGFERLITNLILQWNTNPENDIAFYEAHIDTTSGFTPSAGNLQYSGKGTSFPYKPINIRQIQYAKVRALDFSGNMSNYTSQVSSDINTPHIMIGLATQDTTTSDSTYLTWDTTSTTLTVRGDFIMTDKIGEVPNGSFEIDSDNDGIPDGWTMGLYTGGTGGFDTTNAIHGAKCYYFTVTNPSYGGGVLISDYIPISMYSSFSHIFSVSLWATSDIASRITIYYYDKDKAGLGSTIIFFESMPKEPSIFMKELATKPGARYIKIYLNGGCPSCVNTGTVYFDNCQLDQPMSFDYWDIGDAGTILSQTIIAQAYWFLQQDFIK